MNSEALIRFNTEAYNALCDRYVALHGEIYNTHEQRRLADSIRRCVEAIATDSQTPRALDYGCGPGNLTKHFVALGLQVVAADVTPKFLAMIRERFKDNAGVDVLQLNGNDLSSVGDGYFDIVGTYSVLHHVPDYLAIVRELVRVTKPGGVVYLDHELNPAYWSNDPTYRQFVERARFRPPRTWQIYLQPSRYIGKLRRMGRTCFNWVRPRYMPEGDIHVWPDDHIDFERIEQILSDGNCEVLFKQDYLLFCEGFLPEVYEQYQNRCSDMRLIVGRKRC